MLTRHGTREGGRDQKRSRSRSRRGRRGPETKREQYRDNYGRYQAGGVDRNTKHREHCAYSHRGGDRQDQREHRRSRGRSQKREGKVNAHSQQRQDQQRGQAVDVHERPITPELGPLSTLSATSVSPAKQDHLDKDGEDGGGSSMTRNHEAKACERRATADDVGATLRQLSDQVVRELDNVPPESKLVLEQIQKSLMVVAGNVGKSKRDNGNGNVIETTSKAAGLPPGRGWRPDESGKYREGEKNDMNNADRTRYTPHWSDGEAAIEAIKHFQQFVSDAFRNRTEKSLKFDMEIPATSATEIAYRTKYFLGKGTPILVQVVEEMEGRPWIKPASGNVYAKKVGDSKLGGLRIMIPAINGAAQTEISVQVQLRNGTEGSRPVTVQGTRAGLMQYSKALVMAYGKVCKISAELKTKCEDLDISGYL